MSKAKTEPDNLTLIGFRVPKTIVRRAEKTFAQEQRKRQGHGQVYVMADHWRDLLVAGLNVFEQIP